MKNNPNPGNIIIRRNALDGGFADVSELSVGRAWSAPNFRVPGQVVADSGNPHDIFHIVCEETRMEWKSCSWMGYLGLSVNPQNTANSNKSEPCVFFRHKSTQKWGVVVEWRKWYLVALEECNHKESGRRMDELVGKSLQLVGLSRSEFTVRQFVRAAEKIFNAAELTFKTPGMRYQLLDMMERSYRRAIGYAYMDRVPLVNEEGEITGEYVENMDGSISGIDSTEE